MSDQQKERPEPAADQIWVDNDIRSSGAGEFTIVSVDETHALVMRGSSRRNTRIRLDRFKDGSKRGYTYVGRAR